MVAAKKITSSKKNRVVKKKATKQSAIKKTVTQKPENNEAVVTIQAGKPPVKKIPARKRPVKAPVKKKAIKSMRKTSAWPVVKKKAAVKKSAVVSRSKQLRATVAALKEEIQELKSELKNALKHSNAVVKLSSKREAAVAKFLRSWDRKEMSALEKLGKSKKNKNYKK